MPDKTHDKLAYEIAKKLDISEKDLDTAAFSKTELRDIYSRATKYEKRLEFFEPLIGYSTIVGAFMFLGASLFKNSMTPEAALYTEISGVALAISAYTLMMAETTWNKAPRMRQAILDRAESKREQSGQTAQKVGPDLSL